MGKSHKLIIIYFKVLILPIENLQVAWV